MFATSGLVSGIAVLLCAASARGQITWSVVFDDPQNFLSQWRPQIEQHLLAAGEAWGRELLGACSLEVVVRGSTAVQYGSGRSAVSSLFSSDGGVAVYEQGAAAEVRTGIDPNGFEPDIEITFNPEYVRDELWFDPDPFARLQQVPASRTDAMSVMLHELGHSLAYNGWRQSFTGELPGPYMSTWDRWVTLDSGLLWFGGPNAVLSWGSAPDVNLMVTNHWGNAPGRQNACMNEAPRLLELSTVVPTPPACCALVSAPTYGARGEGGLIDQLMNGIVFYHGRRYYISGLDRAALADAGLELTPPNVPGEFQLIDPAEGATLSLGELFFRWSPSPLAADYELRVFDDAEGMSLVATAISDTTQVYLGPAVSGGQTYYWTVVARNALGFTGAIEGLRSLVVPAAPPTPPSPFALLAPADGSIVATTTPILSWTASTGAVTYSVLIDDALNFSSPEVITNGVVGSSFSAASGVLRDQTRYYWRITAQNASGSTIGSPDTASFGILIPLCPGDANGDRMISFPDITEVLRLWNVSYPGVTNGAGDANHDGFVAFPDVIEVLSRWGGTCP